MELTQLGRLLLLVGVLIVVLGAALMLADRVPFVGRLPGDLTLRGEGWTVYVPIATSIALSVLLTAALNLFARFGQR